MARMVDRRKFLGGAAVAAALPWAPAFAQNAPVRIGFHRRNAKELNWLFNTETIPPVEPRGARQLHGGVAALPVAGSAITANW